MTSQKVDYLWFIEPQLVNQKAPSNMMKYGDFAKEIKETQATKRDYENSLWDRGHLHPYVYQNKAEGRHATLTYTNAIPQDPCFNRIEWQEAEQLAYNTMKDNCHDKVVAYFITGAVPSAFYINYYRVNIPIKICLLLLVVTLEKNTMHSLLVIEQKTNLTHLLYMKMLRC